MKKVFDLFLFFNELDILELRFKMLNDVVDFFVITECDFTFSGKPKSLIFAKNIDRFKKYFDKIIYNPITLKDIEDLKNKNWKDYITDFSKSTPHKSQGKPAKRLHKSLQREIRQRDSALLGLLGKADDKDIVLLSDVDEIPNPETIKNLIDKDLEIPHYLVMKWYMYWMNNEVSEPWVGTVAFNFNVLKGKSLDLLRYSSKDIKNVPGKIVDQGGWHFSYLGGEKAIIEKLNAHPYQGKKAQISMFLNKIGLKPFLKTIGNNKDILLQNRKFEIVPIDENFPNSLIKHKFFIEKYSKI